MNILTKFLAKSLALATLLITGTALAMPAGARAADEWPVAGIQVDRFEATVVDVLCELTGDCRKSCGDGRRQLGLMTAEGTLVLPVKNASNFSGATDDLIAFCGQKIMADGIFAESRGVKIFAVQFVKPHDGKWQRTNRFLNKWAEINGVDPSSGAKKSWFRKDPRINELIAKDGFLGLGAEEDALFLEENY